MNQTVVPCNGSWEMWSFQLHNWDIQGLASLGHSWESRALRNAHHWLQRPVLMPWGWLNESLTRLTQLGCSWLRAPSNLGKLEWHLHPRRIVPSQSRPLGQPAFNRYSISRLGYPVPWWKETSTTSMKTRLAFFACLHSLNSYPWKFRYPFCNHFSESSARKLSSQPELTYNPPYQLVPSTGDC